MPVWRSKYQWGKKAVSAHSGKTTRSQPWDLARRISAIRRAIAWARLSVRAIGPSWAAPTVTMRDIEIVSDEASRAVYTTSMRRMGEGRDRFYVYVRDIFKLRLL